jgi:hypothetical protein
MSSNSDMNPSSNPSIALAPSDVKKDYNLFAIYSFQATLLFMLLSLFPLYKLTNILAKYAGQTTLGPDGFPSLVGIVLHGLVFFLISYVMMVAAKRSKMSLTSTVAVMAGLVVLVALIDMYKIRA